MLARRAVAAVACLAGLCLLPGSALAAAPLAQDDAVTALAGETIVDVLANDSDPDLDPLSITGVSTPAHGTAQVVTTEAGPRVKYVVDPAYGGSADSFTYTVDDGQGGTAIASVSITVNHCPTLGAAIDDGGLLTGERWLACSAADAHADDGATTSLLPVTDGSQALLTTGEAALAAPPDDSAAAGRSNGTALRGAFDVSILRLDLAVPAGADCLGFDLVFASEEYPFFVAEINDGFVAELDTSDWSVSGDVITAPDNFAFDGTGRIVSVKSAFFDPGRVVEANGTEYNGSTPRLEVRTPVTPGPHSLYLSVFDASDDILDSAAFVDNLRSFDAPAGTCQAGANEAPAATDQGVTTNEDTPLAVSLGGVDPDGDPLTHAITTAPAHGTLTGTGASRTYTPDANFDGSDSFSYVVNDGRGGSGTATVTITVDPVNDAPVAADGSASADMGAATRIPLTASDVDDDTLTYAVVAGPAHGTLSGTGSIRAYTPDPGYEGPDSFTFSANDGTAGSNVATISITVEDVNAPPVASSSTVLTDEGTSKDIALSATDADGDPLAYSVVSGPNHGTLTGTGASRTYTPDPGYHGPDSFTWEADDGVVTSNVATVTITVSAVNDPPVAVDGSATTNEDVAAAVTLAASDPDGDSLAFTTVSAPAHGVLTGAGAARTYTPAANWSGTDSFTFQVNDGSADSNLATVTLTVTAVDDPPVAADTAVSTDEDTATALTLSATDAEGDPLTYSIGAGPSHGTLSGSGASRTYTPDAGYHGADSFTFTANDGNAESNAATVSIAAGSVNDVPIASDGSATTDEDAAKALTLGASDADGDALTYAIVSGPAHGSLSGAGTSRTYTPAANYHGPDAFTFRVNDGQADSNVATVSLSVQSMNDMPTVSDGAVDTDVDTAVGFTLEAADVDGDTLSYAILSGPTHGALSGTGSDRTYTPDPGFTGTDSLTFRVNDGQADSAVATVTFDVYSVPSLTINDPGTPEGASGTKPLTFTVTLSEPSARTVSVSYSTQDAGALAPADYLAGLGTLTFSPGDTSEPVVVSVVGDLLAEPNELLAVVLSAPVNARVTAGAAGMGTGTIRNDDECTVLGSPGADTLTGTAGPDVLCGLGGNDTLRGRGGNDRLIGASGNDVLEPGGGDDLVDGGSGTDLVSYAESTRAAVVDLESRVAQAEGTDSMLSVEDVTGSSKADRLRGSGTVNELFGGEGVDDLFGRGGNDRLVGGSGRNDLDGGPGRDQCVGSNGGLRRSCESS